MTAEMLVALAAKMMVVQPLPEILFLCLAVVEKKVLLVSVSGMFGVR